MSNRLTYLGHSAVILSIGGKTIGIDPWLLGNPRCPEKLQTPDSLDLIALTHGHSDHAGDAPRLAKALGSHIAATYELAMLMIEEGVSQNHVHPMNKGGTLNWNGISVSLTHALHSSSYDTAKGPVYAGEACGLVIHSGKNTIYHAGDTSLFSDLKLIGERYRPQIALLPIGDRFTMGPAEAAEAAKLVGCKIAIPIHYKTFAALTGTAEEFGKECAKRGIEARVLEPGEGMDLS